MIEKPPYGAPCNNCGKCCTVEPCPLGQIIFAQPSGRCPALEARGDAFTCGLVEHPEVYEPVRAHIIGKEKLGALALFLIGAGFGCDAFEVGRDRPDEAYSKRLRSYARGEARAAREARRAWGIER